eukprot:4582610-Pleurochrysis_carterae.AAC.1
MPHKEHCRKQSATQNQRTNTTFSNLKTHVELKCCHSASIVAAEGPAARPPHRHAGNSSVTVVGPE